MMLRSRAILLILTILQLLLSTSLSLSSSYSSSLSPGPGSVIIEPDGLVKRVKLDSPQSRLPFASPSSSSSLSSSLSSSELSPLGSSSSSSSSESLSSSSLPFSSPSSPSSSPSSPSSSSLSQSSSSSISKAINSRIQKTKSVDLRSTLECHRREFTFNASRSDRFGRKCWGLVTTMSCWGRCDSMEIADYKYPGKRSWHPVCIHNSTEIRERILQNCDEGVHESLRVYKYIWAISCSCQLCDSSIASCEGAGAIGRYLLQSTSINETKK